jgi:uncharacterized membrane protein YfcA
VIALAVIMFLSGFVHGLAGFGLGMVSMSLLPFWVDVKFASVFVSLVSLIVNLLMLWYLRRSVGIRKVLPIVTGGAIGIPVGVYLLRTLDAGIIKTILGIVLVVFSGYSLLKHRDPKTNIANIWGIPIGICSGVLNGIINMGGSPVVIYTYHKGWDKSAIKATLVLYFTLLLLYKISILVGAGMVTLDMVRSGVIVMPSMLIGAGLGCLLFDRVSRGAMRRITFGLLLIIGLVLLTKR